MTVNSWKLWLAPFALWGVYVCWHSGYQSGYAEGHQTAWQMSRPSPDLALAEPHSERDRNLSSPDDGSAE